MEQIKRLIQQCKADGMSQLATAHRIQAEFPGLFAEEIEADILYWWDRVGEPSHG